MEQGHHAASASGISPPRSDLNPSRPRLASPSLRQSPLNVSAQAGAGLFREVENIVSPALRRGIAGRSLTEAPSTLATILFVVARSDPHSTPEHRARPHHADGTCGGWVMTVPVASCSAGRSSCPSRRMRHAVLWVSPFAFAPHQTLHAWSTLRHSYGHKRANCFKAKHHPPAPPSATPRAPPPPLPVPLPGSPAPGGICRPSAGRAL
jgi:hypothetical protein